MSAGAVEKSVASRQPPDILPEAAQALAAQPAAVVEVVAFRGAPFLPRDSIEVSQAFVAVVQGPVLATVAWILPTTIETRRPLPKALTPLIRFSFQQRHLRHLRHLQLPQQ